MTTGCTSWPLCLFQRRIARLGRECNSLSGVAAGVGCLRATLEQPYTLRLSPSNGEWQFTRLLCGRKEARIEVRQLR